MNVTTKNYAIGARVVRGSSWEPVWDDQDKKSLCGVIKKLNACKDWIDVQWIDRLGQPISKIHAYSIGKPALRFYGKAPLFERGQKVKVCERGNCQGDGFMYKITRTTEAIDAAGDSKGDILDIIFNDNNNKYYYNIQCNNLGQNSYIAEDALIPLDESTDSKPQPKFEVGDKLKFIIADHPRSLVAIGRIDEQGAYTISSRGYGSELKVEEVVYSKIENTYYYRAGITCYREECLGMCEEEPKENSKLQPKFKIGDKLKMVTPRNSECVISKGKLEKEEYDRLGISSLYPGDSIGEVLKIFYCEKNKSFYYLSQKCYPNCYKEDCLELFESTIINNQKPEQNGTEQSTTGKTIEVCDTIGTIPIGKRSTGTVIQGRGSDPSVISRPVSYKAITC